MSKTVKNVEKTKIIPFSSGYLAENLKLALTPLLKLKNVVEKWSSDIFYEKEYSMEVSSRYEDEENIEIELFRKIDENFYINSLKAINDCSELLIGKILLKNNISITDIDQSMLQIKNILYEMFNIGHDLESFLYLDYDYDDYDTLYDTLREVLNNFSIIYTNRNKMTTKLNKKELLHIHIECELSPIYKRILKLTSKILQLDENTRLYNYKVIFKDFSRNLANELFYIAGKSYMCTENYDEIRSKAKEEIEKLFKNLEENSGERKKKLGYVFYDMESTNTDCYYTKKDMELLYSYQELKAATNNLIHSIWRL